MDHRFNRGDRLAFWICDGIPQVGDTGIVVGRILEASATVLVVDPRRGPADRERRLRDSLAMPKAN